MPKYLDGSGLSYLWEKLKTIFGRPEAPYKEVEWVESNGKQYVYLDWKPPINTWGFAADFLIRNAFNSTQAAWNPNTNVNNSGSLFGTRNSSGVNDIELTTFSSSGSLRIGNSTSITSGIKKDKTRQQISLIGTTLTKPDGTTATVTRVNETAGKPYCNMTIFAFHEGLRQSSSGNMVYPGTARIYSLKFYEGSTLKVDLVGAIRKKDGVTGLYDKISSHFYPAPGMTYGNEVGNIGPVDPLLDDIQRNAVQITANNITNTRMWRCTAPMLKRLEDGQKLSVTPMYSVTASYQTTELAGWNDTSNNNYVYVKLTLADGSETDWIPVYYMGTTRLTTHYGSGEPILMTYRENAFYGASETGSGYSVARALYCDPNYNSDTVYDRYSESVIAGKNGVKRYSLCMKDDAGNWTSIVNEANKSGLADKTCYTGGLKLSKIVYHSVGSDYAAGANTGSIWQTYAVDLRYNVNGISSAAASTTLQLRKPFYLVGTLGVDGLFYLDQTKWWTQDEPTTADGKVYILLGQAYGSYYVVYLAAYNPVYAYKNGRFQEIFNGHTVESDVPENAVFTDTTYSAGTGLSLNGTTFANSGATGVKGNSESSYRTGNVNLTAGNVGAVDKTGDTMTGNLVTPSIRAANTYYGVSFGRTTATPVETILYTGIKWASGAHMPVIHITGYAYGLQSPVEFKVAFYIYQNAIGWCGVTNMGAWSPDVYLFKYTRSGVDYVAVGFAGRCYFLQLQADLQDEMGKFANVVLGSEAWSWSFLTATGTIPTPDSGVTCLKVPYKADILNPPKVNGHTVNSDVPSNAVFTDTTYSPMTQAQATAGTSTDGMLISPKVLIDTIGSNVTVVVEDNKIKITSR